MGSACTCILKRGVLGGKLGIGTRVVSSGTYPDYPGTFGEGVELQLKRYNETYKLVIHDDQKISIITPYGSRWGI